MEQCSPSSDAGATAASNEGSEYFGTMEAGLDFAHLSFGSLSLTGFCCRFQ